MRWTTQTAGGATDGLPIPGLVRTTRTPDFAGIRFHEVLAKSALNRVPAHSAMPFSWTVNPYRGCSHACVYCFARNTHTFLDLDAGVDFDSELVVKVNIADVLRAEVSKRGWAREHVALGTNTDPYQRAEGRYRLLPGIIEALADSGTPLSILTKGSLLRRDLPLLAEAAQQVPVDLALSIAVYDDDLQESIEPGTPSTAARLATVRAAAELGFRVRVFVMPVLPYLTDSTDQLDHALSRIADAGAHRVVYGALHLRPGAREWYFAWLERHRPDLLGAYRGMYARSAYAPKAYRRMLTQRIRPLLEQWDLAGRDDDDYLEQAGTTSGADTGTSTSLGMPGVRAAHAPVQPALF